MTEHQGLPVAGYVPQSDDKVTLVNAFKADEERLLRKIDQVQQMSSGHLDATGASYADHRWLAIARTHFQQGFMALNRAVFQPQRIRLPEDDDGPKAA